MNIDFPENSDLVGLAGGSRSFPESQRTHPATKLPVVDSTIASTTVIPCITDPSNALLAKINLITLGDVVIASGAIVPPAAGSPEGVVTAVPGVTYLNSTADSLWIKKSGTGNTGWLQLIATLLFCMSHLMAFTTQAAVTNSPPIVRGLGSTNIIPSFATWAGNATNANFALWSENATNATSAVNSTNFFGLLSLTNLPSAGITTNYLIVIGGGSNLFQYANGLLTNVVTLP